MTGRLLAVSLVVVLLAQPARAQLTPVPPPANRISQTSATEAQQVERATVQEEAPPPVIPPPQLPPPIQPAAWEGSAWVAADALMWWVRGAQLPALLTTSPAGTPAAVAGVPGNGTMALFGHGDVNTDVVFGGAFRAGLYFDDEHKWGAEIGFFLTQPQGTNFGAASTGAPILARPFINGLTDQQAADPIAVPGVTTGAFYASYQTSGILGAGVWLRENFANSRNPFCTCRPCGDCAHGCSGCGGSGCEYRFDGILGYRYLRMSDDLDVLADVTNVAARPNGPAGQRLQTVDQFTARNEFNGLDLGFDGTIYHGPFHLDLLAKIAIGVNSSSVELFGAKAIDGVPQPGGGFLVQSSNFGRFTQNTGTVVPEVGLRLGARLNDNIRIYTGYTLFYWLHVHRAGDAIDRAINPNLLNGGPVADGSIHPAYSRQSDNIWVQGINAGVELRY